MIRSNPIRLALLGGVLLGLSAVVQAAEPAMVENGMLVDSKGMALYTYDQDAMGKSNCYGQCAENWPPLTAEAGAMGDDDWTVVKRDDGTLQWAYYGKPLYTFIKDMKAGEVTGDGKMGVWHVAKPE
jgi:predicted lipoprotein with Yx(FWY)xxD motif